MKTCGCGVSVNGMNLSLDGEEDSGEGIICLVVEYLSV